MANVTITQLPQAGAITGTELVPIVQNGQTVQTTTSAIAGSPTQTYQYLTVVQTPNLPNSRYLSVGTGLGLTDNGAQSTYQIAFNGVCATLESSSSGMLAKVSGTVTPRTLAASGAGLSVSNGDGQSGNPTFSLSGLAASFANLGGSGIVALPNNGTATAVVITGTSNQITVANGDGASGNPTISITSNPALPGTEGVVLPIGGTADRPLVPTNGTIRYNTDTATLEAYANSAWGAIVSGSGVTSVNVSGGSTGLTASGGPITSAGTITLGGTLIVPNGGTGLNSYVAGDTLYYASGDTLSKLAIGSSTFVMTSSGTAPQWTDPASITVGIATTATNIAGGDANRIAYNTGTGTTSFITAPAVANTYLEWSGSAFQWSSNPLGTVTSVDVSGGTTGLTTSGGPITSSGTITLAGTLAVANGGTGQTSYTDGQLLIGNSTGSTLAKATLTAGTGITVTNGSGSITIAATNNGTVTSVDVSGGTTGLTFSGGPVTSSGTITMSGTATTAHGGTGLSTFTAGDMTYYTTGTALSKLGIGSNTYIMTSSGSAPQWSDPAGITVGTATTATNATNVALTANTSNADFFIPLSSASTTGNYSLQVSSGPTINPSTGKVTAGISGGTFLMAQAGYTPIQLYYSTTASAVPTAANLLQGELGLNIADGKLYYEDSGGTVQLLASKDGAAGDVVGPASATDNAIARYDGTTGKLIQNSGVTVDDSNIVTASGFSGPLNGTVGATTPSTGVFTDITLNAQGDVRFADSDSSNYVAFQAPATVASNVTWTLPSADGTSNQVLTTNGSGTLSWSTPAGGATIGQALAFSIIFGL